jgi:hypothetical protein
VPATGLGDWGIYLDFCVEMMGLEPTTPCLQSRCSSQLSYIPGDYFRQCASLRFCMGRQEGTMSTGLSIVDGRRRPSRLRPDPTELVGPTG